jgi:outer membrane protein
MTRRFNLIFAVVFVLISNLAAPVLAAEVSLGLGAGWHSSPYKGHDDAVIPLPFLSVEGERFYLHSLEAGAYLLKNSKQALSLGAAYGGRAFDSDKTDDPALKKLDNRDAILSGVLKYARHGNYGQAGIKISRDILGKSDAFSSEVFYKYPVKLGSVRISPGAGVEWDSKEQLAYYYGISPSEASKSGLAEYKPEAGFSPFISIETVWNISGPWNIMAHGKLLFLSEEIKDSPMVDTGEIFSVAVGLSYTF